MLFIYIDILDILFLNLSFFPPHLSIGYMDIPEHLLYENYIKTNIKKKVAILTILNREDSLFKMRMTKYDNYRSIFLSNLHNWKRLFTPHLV